MQIILQTFHASTNGMSEREVAEELAAIFKENFPEWDVKVHEQLHKFKNNLEFKTYDVVILCDKKDSKGMVKAFKHSLFCDSYVIDGKRYNTEYTIKIMWACRKAVRELTVNN